jgi:membrane fusion protein (multidrug efflux system)
MKMNKKLIVGFKGILVLLFALAISNCTPKQQQQVQIPPQQVNVVKAIQQDIIHNAEFVGQVYGHQDIDIRARVDGFLEGIHFDEGFPVKKGQLLYTIDSQPYRAEVTSYQSRLAEAKIAYAKTQSDLNRYKPLAEANAVSQADLDAAQAQFDAAESSVQAAEANLELANIKLSYTKISSPISGIIGKTQSDIGEYVGKSFETILLNTVSQIDEILVEFFLPENQYLLLIKELQNTDRVFEKNDNTENKLELLLGDGSIHEHKGAVNFIDRGIDPSTGTILIQTRFKNPKRILRPGQYAKVRIPIEEEDAIIIPQKCVVELQGQYSVFVVNSENKVESRQIVAANKSGDYWVISEGLKAGEKIIIDGIQKVRNGSAVEATEIEFKSQTKSN